MLNSHIQHFREGACIACLVALSLLLSSCNQGEENSFLQSFEYHTVEWVDLIPKDDLDALLNPPDFLGDIIDGSQEDQIESKIQSTLENAPKTAYDKALVSTNVVPIFDNKRIRLPGFIVPLEFNENFIVTEFFLVPYFGACLHTPPPPPNQIIYVKHSDGLKLESIEQPYWISGILTTESEANDLAHAAYSMIASDIEIYEE